MSSPSVTILTRQQAAEQWLTQEDDLDVAVVSEIALYQEREVSEETRHALLARMATQPADRQKMTRDIVCSLGSATTNAMFQRWLTEPDVISDRSVFTMVRRHAKRDSVASYQAARAYADVAPARTVRLLLDATRHAQYPLLSHLDREVNLGAMLSPRHIAALCQSPDARVRLWASTRGVAGLATDRAAAPATSRGRSR